MEHNNRIPMPSPEERQAAIRRIARQATDKSPPLWLHLPLSALVFGVEDCLFLAVLLAFAPAALAFMPAESYAEHLTAVLFLTSPLLYAAAHGLTMWKESLDGTLEWKRTCRLPLQTLMALRMLLFGGAAVLVCVPVNLLLWRASGGALPLVRVLGVSFSSLFLHAALSLACRKLWWGAAVPAAVWVLAGTWALYGNSRAADLLPQIPTAVFFLLAGAGLALCAGQLRTMLRNPNKGGFIYYAFR